jgi:hypothetical protein
MGLFDGQDQKQLANKLHSLHSLHSRQEAEYKMAINSGLLNSSPGVLSAYGRQAQERPRIDPNKSEAFQIPLSQLVTMWQVRFGDQWLDGDQHIDEQFYSHAKLRLDRFGLFERFDSYLRLRENAEAVLANR